MEQRITRRINYMNSGVKCWHCNRELQIDKDGNFIRCECREERK